MTIDVVAYHRAVEVSRMKRLMAYRQEDFEKDWEVAISCSILMAAGNPKNFEGILDGCMQRILAFRENNPEMIPFKETV